MRCLSLTIVVMIWLFRCAGVNAEEVKGCEDGARTTISGTIKSIDEVLAWWVTLEDGAQNACKITVLSLDEVPATCKVGGKLSASGKIIDVGLFGQVILDEVKDLRCE